ncbi:hypothetical protein D3C86_1546460 [compost metagenome]
MLLHLLEAVEAPERLPVDDHERRAEHALGHRHLDLGLELVLDLVAGGALVHGDGVDAQRLGQLGQLRRLGDIEVIDEQRPVHRLGERRGHIGAMVVLQPQHRARGVLGGQREVGRALVVDMVEFGGALEVAPAVFALERDARQRRGARRLEHHAQQDRMPRHVAAVLLRDLVDAGAGEVAVGRGKIEVEVDRCGHGEGGSRSDSLALGSGTATGTA